MLNREVYDTKEGIEAACKTLKGLRKIIDIRHHTYYKKKIYLDEFIVYGFLYFDTCGNCMEINYFTNSNYDKVTDLNLPSVITLEELHDMGYGYCASMSNNIPSEHIYCNHCHKKWDINNVRDVVIKNEDFDFPITTEWIGKSILEIKNFLSKKEDGRYFIHSHYGNSDYMLFYKNEKKSRDVNKNYIITEEDVKNEVCVSGSKRVFYHKKCLTEKTKIKLSEIIKNDGKNYRFPNLAGRKEEADVTILAELSMAGIGIVSKKNDCCETEVSYIGKIRGFTFTRAWSYWIVSGPMPLNYALEMYNNPIGKKDVRAGGHAGCESPERYVQYFSPEKKEYVSKAELEKLKQEFGENSKVYSNLLNNNNLEWVENPAEMGAVPIVDHYHIDSLDGLKLYVSYINKGIKLQELMSK